MNGLAATGFGSMGFQPMPRGTTRDPPRQRSFAKGRRRALEDPSRRKAWAGSPCHGEEPLLSRCIDPWGGMAFRLAKPGRATGGLPIRPTVPWRRESMVRSRGKKVARASARGRRCFGLKPERIFSVRENQGADKLRCGMGFQPMHRGTTCDPPNPLPFASGRRRVFESLSRRRHGLEAHATVIELPVPWLIS